jgi:hypothetical protein
MEIKTKLLLRLGSGLGKVAAKGGIVSEHRPCRGGKPEIGRIMLLR